MRERLFILQLALALGGFGSLLHARNLDVTPLISSAPECGAITNLVLTSGQARFLCLPPHRWSLRSDVAADSLVFASQDHSMIKVVFGKATLSAGASLQPGDELRQELMRRSPGTEVLGTGVCFTEAESGCYVDTRWETGNGTSFCSRTAWVKVGGVLVEFELTTTPARFGALTTVFQDFLTTFQAHAPRA
jgi:hypothetical protein